MSSEHPFDDLGTLLRHGDPAGDGSELSLDESADLRRVVLRSARPKATTRWLPLAMAATAAMLAAAVLLPPTISTPTPTAPSSVSVNSKLAPNTEFGTPEAPRQIRFATEKGTQIIWVLDPNLDL